MWSKWFEDTVKKTQQALETASTIVGETYKVAAEKANESMCVFFRTGVFRCSVVSYPHIVSLKAGDKISEMFINKPKDFTYITENVVAMGYPGLPKHPAIGREYNSTNSVSMYLENHHAKHYRIINLSEEKYDYSLFDDSVVEYNYYGLPNPSLGLLVKMCQEMEAYLEEDKANIICIHCVVSTNGVGRTLTLVAAFLTFLGVCDSCTNALTMCVKAREVSLDDILPSQKQYLQYLDQLLLTIQPSSEPLFLKKIILKNIPCFNDQGFRPIFDIYVNGKMKYITNNGKKLQEVPFLNHELVLNEIEFNLPLKGNVYIRCRNYNKNKELKTIFSCMFYTGYIKLFTLQYQKNQLDFAVNNKEIAENFEIVLQFDALSDPSTFTDDEQFANLVVGKKSYWTELNKKRNDLKKKTDDGTKETTPKPKTMDHKVDSRNYIAEINQLETQLSETNAETVDLPASETAELDQLMKEMDIVTENADIDIDNFNIDDLDKALEMNNIDIDLEGEDIQEQTVVVPQEETTFTSQVPEANLVDVDADVDVENLDAGDIVEEN